MALQPPGGAPRPTKDPPESAGAKGRLFSRLPRRIGHGVSGHACGMSFGGVGSIGPRNVPHPAVFLFLIVPFGAMSGYLNVTVVYLLTQAGVSIEASAGLVALSYVPHTWKFLWAPIADTTFTRKKWYLVSSILSSLGIFATGAIPAEGGSLGALTAIVLISNLASTFVGMAVESLMAYCAPEEAKGRAGGWFQAGNLGGYGLGGGFGLWLSQNVPPPWIGSATLA